MEGSIKTKICRICDEEKELDQFYTQKKHSKTKGDWIYYNPECKECTIKRSRKRQLDNHQEYLAYTNENNKKYFSIEENIIKRREFSKRTREKGIYKKWQQNNPEKIKEYSKDKELHRTHKINKNEWENCKNYFNYRCAYCGLPIEQHFIMFKGELILGDFHKEHANHGGNNDLSNCVPSCKSCNAQKNVFPLFEWYSSDNNNFDSERFDKILKWLSEDYKLYIR
jgi:hypothetical protein